MIYALIANSIVENMIVAEPDFIPAIEADWDAVVRVDHLALVPHIGWIYDSGDGSFTSFEG